MAVVVVGVAAGVSLLDAAVLGAAEVVAGVVSDAVAEVVSDAGAEVVAVAEVVADVVAEVSVELVVAVPASAAGVGGVSTVSIM